MAKFVLWFHKNNSEESPEKYFPNTLVFKIQIRNI